MKKDLDQLRQDEDRYQLKTYGKFSIFIEKGEGCHIYDQHGNRYLDLYGGHAVASTGHCHPRVVAAIQSQASQLIFYSNVSYNSVRARAARKLVEMAGQPYHQVFFVNSGSEANENALKLARAITGRREILSVTGSFHGRTYGSLSATGIPSYVRYLNTPVPGHRMLPAKDVAAAISNQTAAVLIEPIQSMGGVQEVPADCLSRIHQACRKHQALLIYDEVQTGIGRTGSFLYAGREGIYPELVTLAKGIASGVPAGALLLTREVADKVQLGDLGSTFGGGPLASAAMEATLQVIQDEDLIGNAGRMGSFLRQALTALPSVEEVLGRGLLLGIRFTADTTAKQVQTGLFERGILAGSSIDPQVLRLMPPLTLNQNQAEEFVEALKLL